MRISLAAYVRRRNRVALGVTGSLTNMLELSLGANTFAGFWRYWNPIWGYALARFIDAPLRKRGLPNSLTIVITFMVCGALHDLVILLVRTLTGKAGDKVTLVFTIWFLFMGLAVVLTTAARWDLSARSWWVRASVNVFWVGVCLALSIWLRRVLGVV